MCFLTWKLDEKVILDDIDIATDLLYVHFNDPFCVNLESIRNGKNRLEDVSFVKSL